MERLSFKDVKFKTKGKVYKRQNVNLIRLTKEKDVSDMDHKNSDYISTFRNRIGISYKRSVHKQESLKKQKFQTGEFFSLYFTVDNLIKLYNKTLKTLRSKRHVNDKNSNTFSRLDLKFEYFFSKISKDWIS